MTENEAIEELKFNNEKCLEQCEGACSSRENTDCACQDAVIERMLYELLQYREIGTVEECREAVEKQKPKKPTWKNGRSIICKDYEDGHGEAEENKWADWVCPECGWFVGEQYLPRQHNQSKCNFCPKCGQAIRWEN